MVIFKRYIYLLGNDFRILISSDVRHFKEIKKIFPNTALIEIPSNHEIFQKPFVFANGLPKIHEHDNKRPQAFGIFENNRLVLLYTYECDLGDGWEDADVNNDPKEVREKALKMGANILNYIFNN